MRKRLTLAVIGGLLLGATLSAQPLSNQVLQLLTRANSWTATNTFLDLRLITGVPSDTVLRFYVDSSGALYFNGNAVTAAGGATLPHNLLSTTHTDTVAAAATRGAVMVGNATPAWAKVSLCPAGNYLGSNGTDTACLTSAAAFTAIPAAQITGTAGAFVGTAITALNASNLTSGTVPLARLVGITNTEVAAGAAIAYSKLNLTGLVLNADIGAAAAIAYSKLALTNSVVTGDIAAGTLLFSDWASNSCTNLQVAQYNGAAWVCKSLAVSDITAGGTVTSVALTAPAIFAVGGTPITTNGTLAVTLATQVKNLVWAGPATGADAAPTFRALANADLPITGIAAATYTKLTINTAGVATAGSSQITASTDVTGVLPMANGGTAVSVSADDTVLIGSGVIWAPQALPNCVAGALNYTTATNAFSCSTTVVAHNLLSTVHGDTTAAAAARGAILVGATGPVWARVTVGTAGQFVVTDGTDTTFGTKISGLTAYTAGSGTLGSTALPFASLILGTAATNTLTLSPAAFAQGTVVSATDPGFTTAVLPLVKRGTIAYTTGAITTGTCAAAVTATVTGLATTSTVVANLDGALQTAWKTGVVYYVYPTANTVNITVCNPTAGTITPESDTFNYTAIVP